MFFEESSVSNACSYIVALVILVGHSNYSYQIKLKVILVASTYKALLAAFGHGIAPRLISLLELMKQSFAYHIMPPAPNCFALYVVFV